MKNILYFFGILALAIGIYSAFGSPVKPKVENVTISRIATEVKDGKVEERVIIGSRDELREKAVQKITKIIFVRHAKRDKSDADGELTDEGWKQVEELNIKLVNEKFDAVFASSTNRGKQTVQELAEKNKVELQPSDLFSSNSERAGFDKIEAELVAKHKVELLSQVPEEDLRSAFAELIESVRARLESFLKENEQLFHLRKTVSP